MIQSVWKNLTGLQKYKSHLNTSGVTLNADRESKTHHVRIEKAPVQTVTIQSEAHNSLEYHYML